jgi:hypothetical protein
MRALIQAGRVLAASASVTSADCRSVLARGNLYALRMPSSGTLGRHCAVRPAAGHRRLGRPRFRAVRLRRLRRTASRPPTLAADSPRSAAASLAAITTRRTSDRACAVLGFASPRRGPSTTLTGSCSCLGADPDLSDRSSAVRHRRQRAPRRTEGLRAQRRRLRQGSDLAGGLPAHRWPTAPSAEHEALEAHFPSLGRTHARLLAAIESGAVSPVSGRVVWRTRSLQDDDDRIARRPRRGSTHTPAPASAGRAPAGRRDASRMNLNCPATRHFRNTGSLGEGCLPSARTLPPWRAPASRVSRRCQPDA